MTWFSTQTGSRVRQVLLDNALEFTCNELENTFAQIGADLVYSHAYCHQQNGAAERLDQTIVKLGRALLISGSVPKFFWGEACKTVVFPLNIVNTCSQTGKSPYEMIFKIKPKISYLQTFGTLCFYYDTAVSKEKFAPCGLPGILVGSTENIDGYRIYQVDQKQMNLRMAFSLHKMKMI